MGILFRFQGVTTPAVVPLPPPDITTTDLQSVNAVSASPTNFVAIVCYYTSRINGTIDYYIVINSPDGINWYRTGYQFNISTVIGSIAYASGVNALFAFERNGLVYKSTDNGVTWTTLAGNSVALYTAAAAINQVSETNGCSGAAVSADGNVIMLPGVSRGHVTFNGTTASGSLYVSTDAGATWVRRYGGAYFNGAPSKIATNNAGTWVTVGSYAGTASPRTWDYIAYSTNNGATWTAVASESVSSGDSTAGYYDVAYANGMWIACGRGRISYSTNGTTWTKVTAGLPSTTEFHSVAYGNGKWVIVAPQTNVAYSSTNGTTWTIDTPPGVTRGNIYSQIAYKDSLFVISDQLMIGTKS